VNFQMQNWFWEESLIMSDPSMIGFMGLPPVDLAGVHSPVEHEIRFKPYQERLHEEHGGIL